MRKLFSILLVFCIASAAAPLQASSLIPSPPELGADSYILMDIQSGRVLVEKNADQRVAPASLTKMMTAYIADREMEAGRLSMDEETTVSVNAWKTGGSRMFLKEGTKVTVRELMHGIIVQSGNDASVALAEHIAGGEGSFAQMMNQQASQLGMDNTHFTNPTGLPDPDMYTTARDMALLSSAKIRDFPDTYDLYSKRHYTYNGIRQPNRNQLLWRDKSVDGLKTGHTDDAGYCLAASAERDGMRLVSVVMGAASEEARARESQQLLNYGFRYYETFRLYEGGEKVTDARVWKGAGDRVDLGIQEDLYLTVPNGAREELEPAVSVESVLEAPIERGEVFGDLTVTHEDSTLAERELVALHSVEQGGLFRRLWDTIKLFFLGLFQ
ncbi:MULTISPECIES: D-alanyl-D-alanine carboxypeptidase family protein [Halomonadaceae]|uniref:serine-type D-Ala-D-Ala carboxypeptidase n=1 Tax=Vreelandella halophila TaxID=86177 RepID=A0A9X5B5W6_9GAMM|nr:MULTISPECIES: D-alanyl-D-alanine carboxypeptidase family protein [Halomonas]MYL26622.1 serine-type D-Ala-D-Ala carboxypeptidase [Halomonas utahensis]MYL73959.1 serine-type D-Ala-D-Ala carboxypeptidase [Halomonas sp. 22501_18_FS]